MKLADCFERRTRDNGERFVTLTDNAPEWLQEAIRDAHQGDLPNDWVYETCSAVADAIDDGSLTDDDGIHEFADSQVDIYTKDLYRWAADACLSSGYSYAEEEADELGSGSSTSDRIARAQYCAIRTIAYTIFQAWEASKESEET